MKTFGDLKVGDVFYDIMMDMFDGRRVFYVNKIIEILHVSGGCIIYRWIDNEGGNGRTVFTESEINLTIFDKDGIVHMVNANDLLKYLNENI